MGDITNIDDHRPAGHKATRPGGASGRELPARVSDLSAARRRKLAPKPQPQPCIKLIPPASERAGTW
jgi:hypothetical protein